MSASPLNSRSLLIAGAWLASIAVTYSLGRLGGDAPETSAISAAASAQPADISSSDRARPSASALFSAEDRRGGAAETIEQVTGGEPLEDWLKRLLKQDDEIVRTTAFLRLLSALETPEDLRKALEIVSASGGRGGWRGAGMREMTMLLQKWTQIDTKGAADYAKELNNNERWFTTSVVLGTWARINPDEALAYAEVNGQGPNPEDGNWGVATVVSQLAKSDVDRALQVASTQDLSRARGRMMDVVISELVAQRGEDAARNTVMSLPPSTFRDNLTAQLAGRLADKDGPGTAQWVMNSVPAGEARSRALAETVNRWADKDPVAAGNFLSQLPVTTETDPARERYAFEVLRQDPEGALAWANTISAEEQRTKAVENLVRAWMRRDRAAAERWVASSSLPVQVRNQLLRN